MTKIKLFPKTDQKALQAAAMFPKADDGLDLSRGYPKDRWIGLPEEHFLRYRNWRNTSGNLCGTYASSVMLAYYQDHLEEGILPKSVREKETDANERLIYSLKNSIQRLGLPTVPVQVSSGINRFLRKYGISARARFYHTKNWQHITKAILAGRPVVVSLIRILGSAYGNHWVTAYAFLETSSGQRYLKIHDNWGRYDRIIPANWVNSTVVLAH